MFTQIIRRRTTKISVACFGFLVGLGLVQAGWQVGIGAVAIAVICGLLACLPRVHVAVLAALFAGLLFGLYRGGLAATAEHELATYVGQKVTLVGQVVTDPTFDDKAHLDIRVQNVVIDGHELAGTVRLKSMSPVDVKRGDTVQATGKLLDGFGNYQASMYYANLQLATQNASWFEDVRRHFAATIYTTIPEPQASLGLGFLLGLKTSLPDSLNDQLKILGLTHIVVASGYNLTVLIRLGRRLFENRSKFQAFAVSTGLLASFLTLTGFSPSMARAGLVTALSLWAWYFGRQIHPIVILLVAAAITAGLNPLFLWYDLGWWLSFLAFAGVLLLAPLLQKRILGEREPKIIVQVLFETVSAQLTTLPLILWVFGDFSVLALPANLLIVPLIPLAMAATFFAGVVSFVSPPLIDAIVSWPATVILGFMTEVIKLLSAVPWAMTPMPITLPIMLGCYGGLLLIGLLLWRATKHRFATRSIIE